MPRKLPATTGLALALALAFAGCGKDDSPQTADKRAATTTTGGAANPATTTPGTKTSGSATTTSAKGASGSATTAGSPGPGAGRSGSTSSGTASTGSATPPTKKSAASTVKKFVGVAPASGTDSGSGSAPPDPSSDTGSGPVQDRLDVVVAVHRYYQGFIEMDGRAVCSLLTTDGQEIMTAEGGEQTCEASAERLLVNAGAQNLALIEQTREELFFDDVTVDDDDAIAQISENRQLRLVRQSGRWLVRSPNFTTGR